MKTESLLNFKEDLIRKLIKEDLKNNKLVFGLNSLGLQADGYFLELSTVVLTLMDFTEEEMEWGHDYYHLRIMEIESEVIETNMLEQIAVKLYMELEGEKKNRQEQIKVGK